MDDIDLTELLNDWPYEPGNVNVRLIRAQDGRQIIQLRIDLGILQMEADGRPDGTRPNGYASLLEYHVEQIRKAQDGTSGRPASSTQPADTDRGDDADSADADDGNGKEDQPDQTDPPGAEIEGGAQAEEVHEPDGSQGADFPGPEHISALGDETGFDSPNPAEGERQLDGYSISPEECRAIREEAVQYYHRYISLYALDEYESVYRDATHNLQLIDLCRKFAESDTDREAMEQLRLHTMMTRVRALAAAAAMRHDSKTALAALDHGLAEMTAYLEALGLDPQDIEEIPEIQLLRGMRDALVPKLPVSQRMELQERLKAAIAAENYELAAILRDELRLLRE